MHNNPIPHEAQQSQSDGTLDLMVLRICSRSLPVPEFNQLCSGPWPHTP